MRKICVVDYHSSYEDIYDKSIISSLIPETDWIDVDDEEFNAIERETRNHKSVLYGRIIIEICEVKTRIPKLKEELLTLLENERKAEQKRLDQQLKEKQERDAKKKEKDKKKREKLLLELKKEFGEQL